MCIWQKNTWQGFFCGVQSKQSRNKSNRRNFITSFAFRTPKLKRSLLVLGGNGNGTGASPAWTTGACSRPTAGALQQGLPARTGRPRLPWILGGGGGGDPPRPAAAGRLPAAGVRRQLGDPNRDPGLIHRGGGRLPRAPPRRVGGLRVGVGGVASEAPGTGARGAVARRGRGEPGAGLGDWFEEQADPGRRGPGALPAGGGSGARGPLGAGPGAGASGGRGGVGGGAAGVAYADRHPGSEGRVVQRV